MSNVCAPTYTKGAWPLLWLVSVAKRNKPLTMLYFTVQSIDLSMECVAWRFWMTRQSNGCSTPSPRSSVVYQWIERTHPNNEEDDLGQFGDTVSATALSAMVVANVLYEKKGVFGKLQILDYKRWLLDQCFCCHSEGQGPVWRPFRREFGRA